jgi:hypothetical protein
MCVNNEEGHGVKGKWSYAEKNDTGLLCRELRV